MSNKFSYKIGYFFGAALIYFLYALGFFGIYLDITDGKLPLLPIVYLFMISVWRKISFFTSSISAFIDTLVAQNNRRDAKSAEIQRMMNTINKFGGPN